MATLEVTCRLRFANIVLAWNEVLESIVSIGIGKRGTDDIPLGVEEINTDIGDGDLVFVLEAIAIAIDVDRAAQGCGPYLAEVVVHQAGPSQDRNRSDQVDDRVVPTVRACFLAPLVIALRLMLADGVGTGRQLREFVRTIGIGARCLQDPTCAIEQVDLNTADPWFIRLDKAVAIVVDKYPARDLGRRDFAKIVVDPIIAAPNRDVAEQVDDRTLASTGADLLTTLQIANRLNLAYRVNTGRELIETILPFGIRSRLFYDFASIVEQLHEDVLDGTIDAFVLEAIAIDIGEDLASDAPGSQLAKVIIDSMQARREHDVLDLIAWIFGCTDR